MKTIQISDIHGKTVWKNLIESENPDLIIFIGDYVDSFDFKDNKSKRIYSQSQANKKREIDDHNKAEAKRQVENFHGILQFDNAIWIIGNHDFHYTIWNKHPYSGYQETLQNELNGLMTKLINDRVFKLAYYIRYNDQDIIFSHAGISQEWVDRVGIEYDSAKDLVEKVNKAFYNDPRIVEHSHFIRSGEYMEGSGDNIFQSPIWIRPTSLMMSPLKLDNIIQIVGHTRQAYVKHITTSNQEFFFTDSLDKETKCLIFD